MYIHATTRAIILTTTTTTTSTTSTTTATTPTTTTTTTPTTDGTSMAFITTMVEGSAVGFFWPTRPKHQEGFM